jgi:hypothetical protein
MKKLETFVFRWILLPLLVVLMVIRYPVTSYKKRNDIKLSYKMLAWMLESGW